MLSSASVLLRCCLLSLLLLGARGQFQQPQISCSSDDTCEASAQCTTGVAPGSQQSAAASSLGLNAPLFCGYDATRIDGRISLTNVQCCSAGWSCRSLWNSSSAYSAGGSWRSGFDCVKDGSAAYEASLDRIEPPRAVPSSASEYCPSEDNCWSVGPAQNFTSCSSLCSASAPCPAALEAADQSPIAFCGRAQLNFTFMEQPMRSEMPSCCHTGWQCRDGFELSVGMVGLQVNMSGYDCVLPQQTAGTTGAGTPPSASFPLGASSSPAAVPAPAFSASSPFQPRQKLYAQQLNSTGRSLYDACESLSSCYPLVEAGQCLESCAAGAECRSPDVIACGGKVTMTMGEYHSSVPACCQAGWQCTDGFSGAVDVQSQSGIVSVSVSGFICQLPQPTATATAAAASASATAFSSPSPASPSSSSSHLGFSFGSSGSGLSSTGAQSFKNALDQEVQQISEQYHVSRGVVVGVAVAGGLLGLSLLCCGVWALWRVCCVYRVKYSAMSGQDDAHEDAGLQHVTDLPVSIDDGRDQTEWERDAVLADGDKQHEPDGI